MVKTHNQSFAVAVVAVVVVATFLVVVVKIHDNMNYVTRKICQFLFKQLRQYFYEVIKIIFLSMLMLFLSGHNAL